MSSRTTRSFVTFVHPFVIDDDIGEIPAGTYEIIAEDEILQSPSFVAYRRKTSRILVKGTRGPGSSQLLPIDPKELELILAKDRALSETLAQSEAALSPLETRK